MKDPIIVCHIEELRYAQEEARYREHIIDCDPDYPESDEWVVQRRRDLRIQEHFELTR